MPVSWEQIEPLLMQVEKPARYVGGEFNQVIKPEAAVRCCLAFPDVYELGMSYHGYRLLYERINNAQEDWAAERAFCPWPDFEALMRRHGVPAYSLETRRPLAEFDWIGLTLQHEVNFTNVLNLIDLAGLPLESAERTAPFPLLIAGGEGAYSPEPLAPFIDAFVVGDGEEIVLEIMTLVEQAKREEWGREQVLRALDGLDGVYVPAFYEVDYRPDGVIAAIRRLPDPASGQALPVEPIKKRHFDISQDEGSLRPVVPLMRTVHDRLTIEIRRGCVNGCRFCQAGMINRPVHERSVEQVLDIARRGIKATGYSDISLLSLSTADHTMIAPMMRRLADTFAAEGISVSLPSIRINAFDVKLADEIAKGRKTGFTFAPEAGSERLRRVINKPVDQENFFQIIDDVFRRGWRTVKFYFMIGLPTETDEDLDGIVEICEQATRLGWKYHKRNAKINVTLSPFVPKSNTPFQWEAQPPREELERRYQYVRSAVIDRLGRKVDIKSANTRSSFFEAVLARGDRRLAPAVRRAWELGARFDGWEEHFNFGLWAQAFEETGIDPAFYANRTREADEIFPFEHIQSTIGRRFLTADLQRAKREHVVESCDTGRCAGCEVCGDTVRHNLARDRREGDPEAVPVAVEAVSVAAEAPEAVPVEKEPSGKRHDYLAALKVAPVQRIRLTFSRQGALRYLSHLDFAKVLLMILRRAEVPMTYSQGFHPQPRLQYAPPLSLGTGALQDHIDLFLARQIAPTELLETLKGLELEGLAFKAAEEVSLSAPSLEAQIKASVYRLEFTNPESTPSGSDLAASLDAFQAKDAFPVEIQKKKGLRVIDLRRSIKAIEAVAGGNGKTLPAVRLEMTHQPGSFVKPHDALGAILGQPMTLGADLRVIHESYVFAKDRESSDV